MPHDPVTDALKRLVTDGADALAIAGVVDFATAEAWRQQDTAHRAFMLFRYGQIDDDLDVRDDPDETQMTAPIMPEPKMQAQSVGTPGG